jgi:hypothetical protein
MEGFFLLVRKGFCRENTVRRLAYFMLELLSSRLTGKKAKCSILDMKY